MTVKQRKNSLVSKFDLLERQNLQLNKELEEFKNVVKVDKNTQRLGINSNVVQIHYDVPS